MWRCPRPDLGCNTTRESSLFAVECFSFPVFGLPMQQIVYITGFFCIVLFVFGLPETFS